MGFTDRCDLFASFHEDGFNNLLRHLMRQRPSLFNYATAEIAKKPELLCEPIILHPIVGKRGNPAVTIMPPLPVPGTDFGLNFCIQLAEIQLDFHPGDKFALPPQLSPPLAAQRFALRLKACAGLGCPPDDILNRLVPPPENPDKKLKDERENRSRDESEKPARPLIPLPSGRLTCFCLEAFVVGSMSIQNYFGKPFLEMRLIGFEIVDIKPEGMENSIECYVKTMLKLAVLPKMRVLLEQTVLDMKEQMDNLKKSIFITLKPTPVGPGVLNNPAVEEHQVKVFVNIEVT